MSTDAKVLGEERIGNYRFSRTLLQGQNSTVMEVVQDGTGKRFAMKQLLASRAQESSERKAFEFEARFGKELQHPNLIGVYEYVKDKNQPYFVMDYFPSIHMRLVMSKPGLFEEYRPKFHRIIEQAAAGLGYLHDKGWVHRDVKPENIIVNKTGETRVIDYALALKVPTGLSKLFASKPPCQGTHSYMSPEQILRQPPAITADIYSFGVTCYEFACRRQPFRANSTHELLKKHIREQPVPPTTFEKNITPEFSDLVMRMIRKNPAERPQSLHEFLSLFNRIRIFQDDPAPAGRDFG